MLAADDTITRLSFYRGLIPHQGHSHPGPRCRFTLLLFSGPRRSRLSDLGALLSLSFRYRFQYYRRSEAAKMKEEAPAMEVIVIPQHEVPRLLPMKECISLMREAFRILAEGETLLPLRPVMWLPEQTGALAMMPAYMRPPGIMGLKVITVFPGNQGTPYDSHQGAVLLFEAEHGRLLSIIDATAITAIRTAAVSGLATDLLARKDSSVLALLGSGVQARTHLEAMLAVREIGQVKVWSRTRHNAERFAQQETLRHAVPIEVAATAQEAVAESDIVCTVTASREPVLRGEWLSQGVHVNAVGASVPAARELDSTAVRRARLFVDRRESAMNEAGDILIPIKEGVISADHILGELADLVTSKIRGRTSDADITLFKSLGLAIEDLMAAHHVYNKARENGGGQQVTLGGLRHG